MQILSNFINIQDSASGLFYKANNIKLENEKIDIISKVNSVSIKNNEIFIINYVIKEEKLLNNIVDITDKDFIIMEKIGKNSGQLIYINRKHSFNKIIPSNHSIIITLKNEITDDKLLFKISLYFKYLYENKKFNLLIKSTGLNTTLSLKELKKMTLPLSFINEDFSDILSIEKYINLILEEKKSSLKTMNYLKNSFLEGKLKINLGIENKKWIKIKSKDILNFYSGKTINAHLKNSFGNINFISINNLNNNHYDKETTMISLNEKDLNKIKSKKQYKEKNDILISLSNNLGVVSNKGIGVFDRHLFKVASSNKKILNDDYLFYLLSSYNIQQQIRRFSVGTSSMVHSYDSKKKLLLNIPSITEQKEIVKTLNIIEEYILHKDKLLVKYNTLKNKLLRDKI